MIHFAPQLFIPKGISDISFYEQAFTAMELQRWSNDDGTIHVAELSIDGAIFHLHEESYNKKQYCPANAQGITTLIGLFVNDVDAVFNQAIEAGGIPVSLPTTYEYNYRQAEIQDPFGHVWLIQTAIEK